MVERIKNNVYLISSAEETYFVESDNIDHVAEIVAIEDAKGNTVSSVTWMRADGTRKDINVRPLESYQYWYGSKKESERIDLRGPGRYQIFGLDGYQKGYEYDNLQEAIDYINEYQGNVKDKETGEIIYSTFLCL